MPVPETTLWSFITQISSALKTIHSAGLSARSLEPNKILMTSKNRLRISCSGLLDVLQYDGKSQTTAMHQQEDLLSFGKLIVTLACNSPQSSSNLPQSFEYVQRFYTPDLKNVALYLLSKPTYSKSIDEVFKLVGPRMLHEANSSQ
jgi:PAB-dependent poly(A)-specific ribonuclease subunit 3